MSAVLPRSLRLLPALYLGIGQKIKDKNDAWLLRDVSQQLQLPSLLLLLLLLFLSPSLSLLGLLIH